MGVLGLSLRSCVGSCAQWGGQRLEKGGREVGCKPRGTLVTRDHPHWILFVAGMP